MAFTGQQFDIAAGKHRATVVEVGAGLRRYTHAGQQVTGTYGDDVLPPRGCGIALFPWPNRIRDGRYTFDGVEQQLALTEPKAGNAMHGLGRWARWTPAAHTRGRVTLGLDIVPQTGYPFEIRAEVTYALHAERGLTVTARATNIGSMPAPFGAGFHPYLSARRRSLDETTVKLPAATHLLVDGQQIPVGTESVKGTRGTCGVAVGSAPTASTTASPTSPSATGGQWPRCAAAPGAHSCGSMRAGAGSSCSPSTTSAGTGRPSPSSR